MSTLHVVPATRLAGVLLASKVLATHWIVPDIRRASPGATDGIGKDGSVLKEVVVGLAVSSGPRCLGRSPRRGIRSILANVGRDLVARKEVGVDALVRIPV